MPERHPWKVNDFNVGGESASLSTSERRRLQEMRDQGLSISAIARATGLNWRTVKKYTREA